MLSFPYGHPIASYVFFRLKIYTRKKIKNSKFICFKKVWSQCQESKCQVLYEVLARTLQSSGRFPKSWKAATNTSAGILFPAGGHSRYWPLTAIHPNCSATTRAVTPGNDTAHRFMSNGVRNNKHIRHLLSERVSWSCCSVCFQYLFIYCVKNESFNFDLDKTICNFLKFCHTFQNQYIKKTFWIFHLALYSTMPPVDEECTEWYSRMTVSTELGGTWKKTVVFTFEIICVYLSGYSVDIHRQPVRTVVLIEN